MERRRLLIALVPLLLIVLALAAAIVFFGGTSFDIRQRAATPQVAVEQKLVGSEALITVAESSAPEAVSTQQFDISLNGGLRTDAKYESFSTTLDLNSKDGSVLGLTTLAQAIATATASPTATATARPTVTSLPRFTIFEFEGVKILANQNLADVFDFEANITKKADGTGYQLTLTGTLKNPGDTTAQELLRTNPVVASVVFNTKGLTKFVTPNITRRSVIATTATSPQPTELIAIPTVTATRPTVCAAASRTPCAGRVVGSQTSYQGRSGICTRSAGTETSPVCSFRPGSTVSPTRLPSPTVTATPTPIRETRFCGASCKLQADCNNGVSYTCSNGRCVNPNCPNGIVISPTPTPTPTKTPTSNLTPTVCPIPVCPTGTVLTSRPVTGGCPTYTCAVVTVTPTTPCKTGVNSFTRGTSCTLSDGSTGMTSARVGCYDGFTGTISEGGRCLSQAQATTLALTFCTGHSSCPTPSVTPTATPTPVRVTPTPTPTLCPWYTFGCRIFITPTPIRVTPTPTPFRVTPTPTRSVITPTPTQTQACTALYQPVCATWDNIYFVTFTSPCEANRYGARVVYGGVCQTRVSPVPTRTLQ